jgi:hypothetical protein
MAVTQKDLDAKKRANDKLREQIEAQQAKAAETVQDRAYEIEGAQLDAENARLTAQLEAAKAAAQAATKKESTVAVLPPEAQPAPAPAEKKE